MLRVHVIREALALRRDARALLLLAVFGLLFAALLVQGSADLRDSAARRAQAEAHARHQWDHQGERHPHRGAHFGIHVFAPSPALAAFDPGMTRYLGHALWLEPHRRNTMRFADADSDVVSLRLGELSPAFLFASVLPLLVFALTFNAVSHERESGTLRMAFGAGVRPRVLVAAKLLVHAGLPALLALLAVALVFALTVHGAGPGAPIAEVALRSLGLLGALAAYALTLAAIGLAVSAAAGSSQQALAILFMAWIALTLVVPRGAAALARTSVALPTAAQFWDAIKHDYEHGLPGDGTLAERGARYDAQLLRQYGVRRMEDVLAGAYALRRLQRDAYADRVHALHFDRLWVRYRQQEAIVGLAGLLSPTVAMRLASMTLSGTDLAHRRHFEEAAERYRQYVNGAIDEWDAANSRGLRSFEDKYAGNALWQSVRRFDYRPPSAGFVLRAAAGPLALLMLWSAIALALLAWCARRLRP